jgi:hypothetical protein
VTVIVSLKRGVDQGRFGAGMQAPMKITGLRAPFLLPPNFITLNETAEDAELAETIDHCTNNKVKF